MKRARIIYRMATGGVVWQLPDSKLQVMWTGPGSILRLGYDLLKPGSSYPTAIEHPTADGNYMTRAQAEKALQAFLAAK
jgi:hypothetical protein